MTTELKARPYGNQRVYDLFVNGKLQVEGESFTVVSEIQRQLIDSVDYWPSETSEVAQRILANL